MCSRVPGTGRPGTAGSPAEEEGRGGEGGGGLGRLGQAVVEQSLLQQLGGLHLPQALLGGLLGHVSLHLLSLQSQLLRAEAGEEGLDLQQQRKVRTN